MSFPSVNVLFVRKTDGERKTLVKKDILILANKYPNPVEPNVCVFIQQLVWQFADLGYSCSVVAPVAVNLNFRYKELEDVSYEKTENNNTVTVYRPKYLSLGQGDGPAQKMRVSITTNLYEMAARSAIEKYKISFDAVYSHFLCPAGVVASRFGKKYHVPAFMAHGEALYAGNEKYGNKRLAKELTGLKGIIAVSSQNRDYVVNAGIVKPEIVGVFPNGYRKERFYPRDKIASRKKFGFPEDVFIVGMVGSFDERKGTLRIQTACDQLNDVYFACAGKGEAVPTSQKCLWAKPVNNDVLPWFYSALDAFVLPTQNEGCCNAIVEAIACGCPIISSDKSFNYDICDKTNSILIDPMDITAIANSIAYLKDNREVLEKLRQGSIKKSEKLDIGQRAVNIMEFINEKSK